MAVTQQAPARTAGTPAGRTQPAPRHTVAPLAAGAPASRARQPSPDALDQVLARAVDDRATAQLQRVRERGVGVVEDESGRARAAVAIDDPMAPPRTLDFVKIKRKNIHVFGKDQYGHWWTEVDGATSYGWWPKKIVGPIDTLIGTPGELNGVTSFGGTRNKDPHHGDIAEEEFSPTLNVRKTDSQVRNEIKAYAQGYHGDWRWTFGYGQNCHTFQVGLMDALGMSE